MIKRRDLFVLFFFPIFFSVLSILIHANFLSMILIFFGTLAIYLSLKREKDIDKAIIFAASLLPLMIIIDYLTSFNGAWTVAPSITNVRILGISRVENILWGFLRIYSVVLFYEWLINKKEKFVRNKMKYASIISLCIFIIFLITLNLNPLLFELKNIYVLVGTVFGIIPFGLFLLFRKNKIQNLIFPAGYFFYFCIFFEFTGLYLNNWVFAGKDYLLVFRLSGFALPIEELIWLALGSSIILIYYIFFREEIKKLK